MTPRRRDTEQSRLVRAASFPTEIHLRRMKVRPALIELEKYLEGASSAGLPRVRVIHGKGTGTLKDAVIEFLSRNPLVARHQAASPAEGDGGVTIAIMN